VTRIFSARRLSAAVCYCLGRNHVTAAEIQLALSVSCAAAVETMEALVAWGIVVPAGGIRWRVLIDWYHRQEVLRVLTEHAGGPVPFPNPLTSLQRELPEHRRLSARDRQILFQVALGATNGEIGRKMNLAESTVKAHLRRIYRTIDARDRANAVHIAHELRFFDEIVIRVG
jgi:DNA-binding CsgD family transcriptional regulator